MAWPGFICIFFPKATGKAKKKENKTKEEEEENKTEYLQKLVTLKQAGTLIPCQQPHGADVWLKGLQTG